ncbi:putative G2-specific protein kinase nim-1 [Blattamonas nauphoetae]|uniref:non-specific serine/threonine protein kinase n=1 Tax=Blattamonas nauphoetae TaxID=2049346 RepID=A0ABQ9X988_9EUKA|nr:putative G2-specific protein kinase nim-1 [Blattamonas nauphoetae]
MSSEPPIFSNSSKNDYTFLRKIGQGAYGRVYLAIQKRTNRTFVVKTMECMCDEEAEDASKEIGLLSSLHSPLIVGFEESFVHKESVFIVMEYCDSGDAGQLIRRYRKENKLIPESKILDIFTHITFALRELHKQKVLHRDIKSENVYLTTPGVAKLGDFGVSRNLRHTFEMASTMTGTPFYMSPELLTGQLYNSKSDIWSLGVLFYELATLHVPFNATNIPQLLQRIEDGEVDALPAQYSADMSELVINILDTDSNARPSANDLLHYPIIVKRMKDFVKFWRGPGLSEEEQQQSNTPSFRAVLSEYDTFLQSLQPVQPLPPPSKSRLSTRFQKVTIDPTLPISSLLSQLRSPSLLSSFTDTNPSLSTSSVTKQFQPSAASLSIYQECLSRIFEHFADQADLSQYFLDQHFLTSLNGILDLCISILHNTLGLAVNGTVTDGRQLTQVFGVIKMISTILASMNQVDPHHHIVIPDHEVFSTFIAMLGTLCHAFVSLVEGRFNDSVTKPQCFLPNSETDENPTLFSATFSILSTLLVLLKSSSELISQEQFAHILSSILVLLPCPLLLTTYQADALVVIMCIQEIARRGTKVVGTQTRNQFDLEFESAKAIENIAAFITLNRSQLLNEHCSLAIAMISKYKPLSPSLGSVVRVLGEMLVSGDPEPTLDACYALLALSEHPGNHSMLFSSNVVPVLIVLLKCDFAEIASTAAFILLDVARSSEKGVKRGGLGATATPSNRTRLLECGVLETVVPLIVGLRELFEDDSPSKPPSPHSVTSPRLSTPSRPSSFVFVSHEHAQIKEHERWDRENAEWNVVPSSHNTTFSSPNVPPSSHSTDSQIGDTNPSSNTTPTARSPKHEHNSFTTPLSPTNTRSPHSNLASSLPNPSLLQSSLSASPLQSSISSSPLQSSFSSSPSTCSSEVSLAVRSEIAEPLFWILNHLVSDGDEGVIERVLELGVLSSLLFFPTHSLNSKLMKKAAFVTSASSLEKVPFLSLMVLSEIVQGSHSQVRRVVDGGLLRCVAKVLEIVGGRKSLHVYSCRILLRIAQSGSRVSSPSPLFLLPSSFISREPVRFSAHSDPPKTDISPRPSHPNSFFSAFTPELLLSALAMFSSSSSSHLAQTIALFFIFLFAGRVFPSSLLGLVQTVLGGEKEGRERKRDKRKGDKKDTEEKNKKTGEETTKREKDVLSALQTLWLHPSDVNRLNDDAFDQIKRDPISLSAVLSELADEERGRRLEPALSQFPSIPSAAQYLSSPRDVMEMSTQRPFWSHPSSNGVLLLGESAVSLSSTPTTLVLIPTFMTGLWRFVCVVGSEEKREDERVGVCDVEGGKGRTGSVVQPSSLSPLSPTNQLHSPLTSNAPTSSPFSSPPHTPTFASSPPNPLSIHQQLHSAVTSSALPPSQPGADRKNENPLVKRRAEGQKSRTQSLHSVSSVRHSSRFKVGKKEEGGSPPSLGLLSTTSLFPSHFVSVVGCVAASVGMQSSGEVLVGGSVGGRVSGWKEGQELGIQLDMTRRTAVFFVDNTPLPFVFTRLPPNLAIAVTLTQPGSSVRFVSLNEITKDQLIPQPPQSLTINSRL